MAVNRHGKAGLRSKLPGSLFGLEVSPARTYLSRVKGRDYLENELDCFLSLFDYSGKEVTVNPDGLSRQRRRYGARR